MYRLIEIKDVTFCGCAIILRADDASLSDDAFRDAARIFKDAYGNCILDNSKITQRPKKKKK